MSKIPQEILDGIKWEFEYDPTKIKGGQHVAIAGKGIKLTHKELGFEIGVNYFRSQIINREFCMTVFELFLSEIKVI